MSSINNLSAAQLHRAASLKERIEKLQTKLNGLLGSSSAAPKAAASSTASAPSAAPKKRRKMSAEGRARIAAAARARWAKVRAAQK